LEEDPARIAFSSKQGGLFPVEPEAPSTLQRIVLVDPSRAQKSDHPIKYDMAAAADTVAAIQD
jgi:hypothetical protein